METQSPINPGDSGGPMINGRGQLIGVVQGFTGKETLRSWGIDVTEARDFVTAHFNAIGIKWAPEAAPGIPSSQAALTALLKLQRSLQDSDAKVRREAAISLGAMGLDARGAIPALLDLLNDQDEQVRRTAQQALSQLGPPDKTELPLLIAVLAKGHVDSRRYALQALEKFGPDARSASKPLADLLQDPDVDIRVRAARILGNIGIGVVDAVPSLTGALADPSTEVRLEVILALNSIGPSAKDAIPSLQQVALKDVDPDIRLHALCTIPELGMVTPADAKILIPQLAKGLSHNSPVMRLLVVEALAAFGDQAAPAASELGKALIDKDSRVRHKAVEALAAIGPGAKAGIPALIGALEDDDLRSAAARALIKVGEPSVGPVVQLLFDKRRGIRLLAIDILAELGPQAKGSIGALEKLMRADPWAEVRVSAQSAIRRISAKP